MTTAPTPDDTRDPNYVAPVQQIFCVAQGDAVDFSNRIEPMRDLYEELCKDPYLTVELYVQYISVAVSTLEAIRALVNDLHKHKAGTKMVIDRRVGIERPAPPPPPEIVPMAVEEANRIYAGVNKETKLHSFHSFLAGIRAAEAYHGERSRDVQAVQADSTPEEASTVLRTAGEVPKGKTWAQHTVDHIRGSS